MWNEDFSLNNYGRILEAVTSVRAQRLFADAPKFLQDQSSQVYVRHDVDICLSRAIEIGSFEQALGVRSTFFVMLDSLLYDLRRDALSELQALGHEVGLHYDCPDEHRISGTLEFITPLIDKDCKRLEDVIGTPVRSISFHRPVPYLLRGPLIVAGRVSAYAADFMHWYISDSAGRWRCGDPLVELAHNRHHVLQVLTHPIWWGERHAAPQVRLREFVRSKALDERGTNSLEQALALTVPGAFRERY